MNTEYRELLAQKLFEKETALLPSTVYYVELLKENDCLRRGREVLEKKMNLLSQQINDINLIIHSNTREVTGLVPQRYVPETIGPCPKEGCRGFVLRRSGKCGVCGCDICKDCMEVKLNDEHVCVKENVESAKLISKDSKPCPKCAAFIFKIDGCDQMWCSLCKTAFSWKTGQIEKGRIHNPHYYDWLRTTGEIRREPDDNDCNEQFLITAFQLQQIFTRYNGLHSEILSSIFQKVVHVSEVDIPTLRDVVEKNSNNRDLRIKYLMNKITPESFKTELESRARVVRKMSSVLDCLVLFYEVMRDSLRLLYETRQSINKTIEGYIKICEFTNENIAKAEKTYRCSFKRYKITY
jgi:hypothetical protein